MTCWLVGGRSIAAGRPHFLHWRLRRHLMSSQSSSALPFSAIPGPVSLPVLGSLWMYKLGISRVSSYHDTLHHLYEKYGRIVKQRFASAVVVHVFDPEDVKIVHQNEGKYPEVPPLQETALIYRKQKGMSLGLGNTNGEEWHRLRSAVQQMMMRPTQVVSFLPLVNGVSRQLTSRLSCEVDAEGRVAHLERLIYKWALESSCLVCTEHQFGALDGGDSERLAERMILANRRIFQLSARLKFAVPVYKYISTPGWQKLIEAEDFFYSVAMDLFTRAISTVRQKIDSGQFHDGDFAFLTYLLSRQDISRDDVLIIAFSMFSDGLSTTVPAMLALLYCLSRSPSVQNQLYGDICDVISPPSVIGCADSDQCEVTADIINRLPLLRAAVKEALRLYPIGTEVSRRTNMDLVLGGYHIPAGTHVDLNQAIHLRSNHWFDNPDQFCPQRWLSAKNRLKSPHPYLHIPFGHGTRMCAGRRFAEQDLYTTLVHILRRFRLVADGDDVTTHSDDVTHSGSQLMRQRYETLLVPDQPIRVRFLRR